MMKICIDGICTYGSCCGNLRNIFKCLEHNFHDHFYPIYFKVHQAKLRELETLKKKYHDNMAELETLQVKV